MHPPPQWYSAGNRPSHRPLPLSSYDLGMRSRNRLLGPAARPVALPAPDYNRSKVRAQGSVVLPTHIRWSEPFLRYDLGDERDRIRVYEQVLREGTAADIQEYIDVDQVAALWDQLVLPPPVRRAWMFWLRDHRGILVRC